MKAAAKLEEQDLLTMGRYGVDSVTFGDRVIQVPSLPDFEGVFHNGTQFMIEAKTCAGASFPMEKSKIKPKQLEHLLKRSAFGVPCFLLIHFNARNLVTSQQPAFTVAIPVQPDNPRWQKFVDAYREMDRLNRGKPEAERVKVEPQGSISRDLAQDMGILVPWYVPPRARKPLPDLKSFLKIPPMPKLLSDLFPMT